MPDSLNVAVLVGSLRRDSINRKVALNLIALAPPTLTLELVDIGHLPLYNQDFDADSPEAYVKFREQISSADAVLFVTPEHNRSVPAAMKNAVDIGSRPPGKNVWNKKPGGVISASPSLQGGFGANHHLRQSLVCLNVLCMPQPETYISRANLLFDEAGKIAEPGRVLLQKFIDSYAAWVGQFRPNPA
jgi:chromate reductase, NAD(P)H dehydrogenase (quinone)